MNSKTNPRTYWQQQGMKFVRNWRNVYPDAFRLPDFDISKATVRHHTLQEKPPAVDLPKREVDRLIEKWRQRGA